MDLPHQIEEKRVRADTARRELFEDDADMAKRLALPYTSLRRALEPDPSSVARVSTLEKRLDQIGDALIDREGVSRDWWQRGEGPMRIGGGDSVQGVAISTGAGETAAALSLTKRLRENTTLQLYTAVAAAPSADAGALVFDEASRISVTLPRVICRQWLGFDPPEVMGVSEVTGDSMEPILYDGDLVLYSLTPEVDGGGLFVVNYDGRMLCKRVQQLGSVYRLIPENRLAGYVAERIRATDAGFVHEDTEDEIGFGIVGKILWPNQHTSRLHMQQVGELLRRMFREAADNQ
jgi:phage repressor protein C with HTH and peptisase S24 domain